MNTKRGEHNARPTYILFGNYTQDLVLRIKEAPRKLEMMCRIFRSDGVESKESSIPLASTTSSWLLRRATKRRWLESEHFSLVRGLERCVWKRWWQFRKQSGLRQSRGPHKANLKIEDIR